MSFDVNSTEFWDPQATQKEVRRVFDICYGCTLCHTLCPSFVNLFQLMDENFGEADRLKDEQVKGVVDLCYQCKLCYPICPYVPPHEWDVDFPRTVMRTNLVEKKSTGARFSDRVFGDTDTVGKLSSLAAAARQLGQPKFLFARLDGKVFGHPPRPPASHFSRKDFRQMDSQTSCSPQGQRAGKSGALLYLHGQL